MKTAGAPNHSAEIKAIGASKYCCRQFIKLYTAHSARANAPRTMQRKEEQTKDRMDHEQKSSSIKLKHAS